MDIRNIKSVENNGFERIILLRQSQFLPDIQRTQVLMPVLPEDKTLLTEHFWTLYIDAFSN